MNDKRRTQKPDDSIPEPGMRVIIDSDAHALNYIAEDLWQAQYAEWLLGRQKPRPAVARGRTSLRAALKNLEKTGLQLDANRLRRNICSPFADYRLWIRELIVNAFDAGAKSCRISGTEDLQTITIHVSDDGHGMDRQGVETFLRKFSSRKDQPETAVGRFGIGCFSVAAIPRQCRFSVITSTGQETWRMETGTLLSSLPINVERVTPVQPAGTTVSVSFGKGRSGLGDEMNQLFQLARKYLYYLPINVSFDFPKDYNRPEKESPGWVPGNWIQDPEERFSRRFCFTLNEHAFDVVMGVGPARQQLYQKRVLITENKWRHDLLGQDLSLQRPSLAHLSIRVDSPQFELPLGRHCLSDTEVNESTHSKVRGFAFGS